MKLTEDPFSIIQAVTASGVIVWDAIDEEIIAANQTAAQLVDLPLDTLLRFAVCRPHHSAVTSGHPGRCPTNSASSSPLEEHDGREHGEDQQRCSRTRISPHPALPVA
jgi:hypothetical protein